MSLFVFLFYFIGVLCFYLSFASACGRSPACHFFSFNTRDRGAIFDRKSSPIAFANGGQTPQIFPGRNQLPTSPPDGRTLFCPNQEGRSQRPNSSQYNPPVQPSRPVSFPPPERSPNEAPAVTRSAAMSSMRRRPVPRDKGQSEIDQSPDEATFSPPGFPLLIPRPTPGLSVVCWGLPSCPNLRT